MAGATLRVDAPRLSSVPLGDSGNTASTWSIEPAIRDLRDPSCSQKNPAHADTDAVGRSADVDAMRRADVANTSVVTQAAAAIEGAQPPSAERLARGSGLDLATPAYPTREGCEHISVEHQTNLEILRMNEPAYPGISPHP